MSKENQNTEWKASWHDDYLKWVSAFANTDGGKLILGKDDTGKIVGVKDAARLLVEIPNKIRNILGIIASLQLKKKEGKEYIEINVEPYSYPISHKGSYFIRTGSTTLELTGTALSHFLLRKHGQRWDGVPVPGLTQKDFDRNALKLFRERAAKSKRLSPDILTENDAHLMEKLHLKEAGHFKRSAVLLFHSDPEKYVTGAYIKIGYFESDADLLYHDEIHGDLLSQVQKTMELLLTKYLKARISYQGLQRIETYPIPEEALRETLVNAVVHKDYGSNTPIQISVYADKIMFWNNGRLQAGWTVKTLTQKHSSQPFNPDIANVFFRAGMIEAWGRGIERIMTACKDARIPSPILKYEATGLWVEFKILTEPGQAKTDPVGDPVTDPVGRLLLVLSDKTLAPSAIQKMLRLRHRPTFRTNYLHPALDQKLIEMTIPDKPNSRLQQYRATKAGKAKMAKIKSGK